MLDHYTIIPLDPDITDQDGDPVRQNVVGKDANRRPADIWLPMGLDHERVGPVALDITVTSENTNNENVIEDLVTGGTFVIKNRALDACCDESCDKEDKR